jgi:hypothetical protein
MPAKLQAATVRRSELTGMRLCDLRTWLKEAHDVKTSETALCEWFKRRKSEAAARQDSPAFPFTIRVRRDPRTRGILLTFHLLNGKGRASQ